MKNSRIILPIFALVILLVLVFALAIFKSILSNHSTASTNTPVGVLSDGAVLSSSKIFFQGPITTLPDAPQKTVVEPKNTKGLSVYWIQESSQNGGNDTCTLYDSATNQIYATSYRTQLSGRTTGSMYYTNDKVQAEKSLDLLSSTCFK